MKELSLKLRGKKMLSKTSLYFFPVILGICLSSFAMERDDCTKDGQNTPNQSQVVFRSAEEMSNYGQMLVREAIFNKNYDLVFELAPFDPVFVYKVVDSSDVECYLYYRKFALTCAYMGLANDKDLSPKQAKRNYVSAIKEINEYLKEFGSYNSNIQTANDLMLSHRQSMYEMAGTAYFYISSFSRNDDDKQRASLFNKSLTAFELSLAYGDKVLDLSDTVWITTQNALKNINLPKIRHTLITIYCALSTLDNDNESLIKARNIYKKGKQDKWDIELLKIDLEIINKYENSLRIKMQNNNPQKSKKVQNIRNKNYINQQNNWSEKGEKILQNNKSLTFHHKINNKHSSLITLISLDPELYAQNAIKIKDGLIDIEKTLASHLGLNSLYTFSWNDLEAIYEEMSDHLTMEIMSLASGHFIPAFIICGDMEGAIQRADILKKLETKHNGEPSDLTRFVAAATKNLVGDTEEWMLLEKEMQEIRQQKEERKKIEKEKNEQLRQEAIKLTLTQQQKMKKKLETSKKPPLNVQSLGKPSVEKDENAIVEEPMVLDKQRRLNKQQRHEEAEAKRQNNIMSPKESLGDQKISQSTTKVEKPSKKAEPDLLLTSSDKNLRELYNLTGLPLKVDEEIEQETWRFRRDEFRVYLEAMGCVYKSGKGIHTKASLPKATHVMQGEKVVTILNDFGGALTLPLWHKDYVPDYLKIQILEARKKLRALKLNTQNIAKGF